MSITVMNEYKNNCRKYSSQKLAEYVVKCIRNNITIKQNNVAYEILNIQEMFRQKFRSRNFYENINVIYSIIDKFLELCNSDVLFLFWNQTNRNRITNEWLMSEKGKCPCVFVLYPIWRLDDSELYSLFLTFFGKLFFDLFIIDHYIKTDPEYSDFDEEFGVNLHNFIKIAFPMQYQCSCYFCKYPRTKVFGYCISSLTKFYFGNSSYYDSLNNKTKVFFHEILSEYSFAFTPFIYSCFVHLGFSFEYWCPKFLTHDATDYNFDCPKLHANSSAINFVGQVINVFCPWIFNSCDDFGIDVLTYSLFY